MRRKSLTWTKKNIFLVFFIISAFFVKVSWSNTESGLILSGLDTLDGGKGFDFVLQRACTSSSDLSCDAHFKFFWDGPYGFYFSQLTDQGLVLDKGKMNLDSIKSAPPDSQMFADLGLGQYYMIFRIAPDSLQKCVGNCYVFKTGNDSRMGHPLYAKIKIIKFMVIDSATHKIMMKFIYAAQLNGTHDITTTGLDTFHLDTPTLSRPDNHFANSLNRTSPGQYVFKVVGDKFVLPRELVGKVKWLTVWDLRGRRMGRIEVGADNNIIDLEKIESKGMLIVRVDKNNNRIQ